MKRITLKVAFFEAIKQQQGSAAAVEAIRAEIQSHAPDIEIELNHRGPNQDNERVASLSFVNAASLKVQSKTVRVNLLTCGFAATDDLATDALYTALTNPQVPVVVRPDILEDDDETPKEPEKEEIGLTVGSHSHPTVFVKFER